MDINKNNIEVIKGLLTLVSQLTICAFKAGLECKETLQPNEEVLNTINPTKTTPIEDYVVNENQNKIAEIIDEYLNGATQL